MMFRNLKVGDTVFCLRNRGRWDGAASVIITKVGRKWATFQNQWGIDVRFNMADGGVEDRYRGYIFPSHEAWQADHDRRMAECAAEEAWAAFHRTVHQMWRRPEHLDANAIEALTAKLRGSGARATE